MIILTSSCRFYDSCPDKAWGFRKKGKGKKRQGLRERGVQNNRRPGVLGDEYGITESVEGILAVLADGAGKQYGGKLAASGTGIS